MSTLKAEVVRVAVEPHPNADRLDIVKVKGWQCVSQKGQYQTGDLAIYLPVDSVLPEPLVKELGIEKFYNKRLRTIKLRGALSQGMIMRVPETLKPADTDLTEGVDFTEALGITKYDPPIPVHMQGKARKSHPMFQKYTDIENYKNYLDLLQDGEEVVITEKLHGTNARIANLDDGIHVGSHRMDLIEDPQNLYWRAAAILDSVLKGIPTNQHVFFEVIGAGVQKLAYGFKPGEIGARVFDVFDGSKYLDYDDLLKELARYGLSDQNVAPVLYRGPWNKDLAKLAAGDSTFVPGQIREGVVVKPVKERWDSRVGRVILKIINDAYLEQKDKSDEEDSFVAH